MSGLTYYKKNRDVILNRANDYYENDKERLREQVKNKYRNLFEEVKRENMEKTDTIICQKKKKQKLKEYQKNYREAKKSQSNSQ